MDDFFHSDENFLKLERALVDVPEASGLWKLRVNIFSHLALPIGTPRARRFSLGLLSYITWLCVQYVRSPKAAIRPHLPQADFLILVYGTVSKEYDTLQPLASALINRGQSVLVLWVSDGEIPKQMRRDLAGTTIWQVDPAQVLSEIRRSPLADVFTTAKALAGIARSLWSLRGFYKAFRHNGQKLFDYLFHLRLWDRFLEETLIRQQLKGIALVSDTSLPGEALSRLAELRRWPIHHFLHGFPSLAHTRTLATHVHCFSTVDRAFFIAHGWAPHRVHSCGHPRQISLSLKVRQERISHPYDDELRVLYVGVPRDLGGFDSKHYTETLETLLCAAKQAQLRPANLRIRLHPAESVEGFFRLIELNFPEYRETAVSCRTVVEDLAWAQLIVTSYSTMAIEASYSGCMLVWLTVGTFQYAVRDNLISAGYGMRVRTHSELAQLFDSCQDPSRRALLFEDMHASAEKLRILTTNTAEHIASLMLSLTHSRNVRTNTVETQRFT